VALSGWTKKCLITVAASKLAQTVTNQVILLTAAHFNSEMVTLGHANACKTDGSDLRFSSDANGDTLLAYDLLNISLSATPASSELVVALRIPSVAANASFSFYVHWGNSNAEVPAKDSASGAGTCWSNLYGVIPFKENPALYTTTAQKWKAFKESTGRYSAGNIVNAPTRVAGPIPGMKAIQVSAASGYVQIPEVAATNRGGFQFAMICNFATVVGLIFSQSQSTSDGFYFNSSGVAVVQYSGDYSQNYLDSNNAWGILRVEMNAAGTTITLRFRARSSTITWSGPFTNLQFIGGGTDSMNAKICLFMLNIFSTVTDDFFKNLINCIDNNATLASAGSITAVSSSNVLTITGLIADSEVRIFRDSDGVELAGTESSTTSFTYNFSYTADTPVRIVVLHLQYEYISLPLTLVNSNLTVPIQQRPDRVYLNP
jgi:hypothetical protein